MTNNYSACVYASTSAITFITAYFVEGILQMIFAICGVGYLLIATSYIGKNDNNDQSSNIRRPKWVKSVQLITPVVALALCVLFIMDSICDDRATRHARAICGAQGIDKIESSRFFKHSYECK